MKAALFASIVLALMLVVLRGGGLRPVAAQPEPPDAQMAISQVQSFTPLPPNPETLFQRIDRVIGTSREAGHTEDILGWSAAPLGERRYSVKFEVLENGSWIGAEWIVNLSNGWVGPVNEYAAWLMFDRSW